MSAAGGNTNPVILLAGIWDPPSVLDPMCAYLEAHGRRTHRFVYLPNDGRAVLGSLARQMADYVEARFAGGEKIDVVGFSMGGLVARYYVQRLAHARHGIQHQAHAGRVERLITISSPHRGTWTAFCLARPGVRQMRPGSDFLHALTEDPGGLREVRFTSIWTPLDLMIIPASSSATPEARSVRVTVPIHHLMLRDRRVFRLVDQELAGHHWPNT